MTDTMTRPTNEGSCGCGCGDPANAEAGTDGDTGACNCGCGSAAGSASSASRTVAEEVAHLTELRQSIDRRLSELKS